MRKFLKIKREGEIISEIYETVKEINDKLLGSDCDIVECLKKARYVVKFFNDVEILKWIDNELNGYSEGYLRDLPSYRKIKALMYGKKPFNFLYPLSIEDAILRSREKNGICELVQYVDEPQFRGQIYLVVNVSEFKNIINAVNIKLSDYIQEKLISIKKILFETSNNGNNIKEFIEKLFWKPTVEILETKLFKNESGLHTKLLEKIKTQLNKFHIIELHNLRDEISIDLLFKCKKFSGKIGISVEATSDIAEIRKDKRNISFPKTIKAKMKDIDRIRDLDLFVILFCIDLTVKSYKDTLRIMIAELEKINDPKVFYIAPENLVEFFKDFNINNEKLNN